MTSHLQYKMFTSIYKHKSSSEISRDSFFLSLFGVCRIKLTVTAVKYQYYHVLAK